MAESSLIPGPLEDVVVEHIEPIMVVTPNPSQYIDYNVSLMDFMVLSWFINTWELTRLGAFILTWGKCTTHFNWFFELHIKNNQRFHEVRGMILLHKALDKYFRKKFILSIMKLVVILIEWQVQHARLDDLGIMQLQYLLRHACGKYRLSWWSSRQTMEMHQLVDSSFTTTFVVNI